MKKVRIFSYPKWDDYTWGNGIIVPRVQSRMMRDLAGKPVVERDDYFICKCDDSGTHIMKEWTVEVHDTDMDGYSVERGLEFLIDTDSYFDTLLEYFGIEITDHDKEDVLFEALSDKIIKFVESDDWEMFDWFKTKVMGNGFQDWLKENEMGINIGEVL